MKIKKILICIFAVSILFMNVSGGSDGKGSITLPRIPTSIEDFLKLRDELGKTPQAGVALFIAAMIIYDSDQDMGLKCYTICLDRSKLSDASTYAVYKGYGPSRNFLYYLGQHKKFPYLGNIYIQNTLTASSYKLPNKPYKLKYRQFTESGDTAKLYLETTSKNMARPVTLKKNNKGIWKVLEVSSMFVGPSAVPKKKAVDDDL